MFIYTRRRRVCMYIFISRCKSDVDMSDHADRGVSVCIVLYMIHKDNDGDAATGVSRSRIGENEVVSGQVPLL